MKTIKQKFSDSKLSIIVVLFFSLILLVTGGFATRKAKAEETKFAESSFVMCTGAEVRTDGEKSGIRFVARLGEVLPSSEDYTDLTYNVMIVPQVYITKYNKEGALENNWYEGLNSALEADGVSVTLATMRAEPFKDEQVEGKPNEWYIRGTLSKVKYDNINREWFGMAYLTYTEEGETKYVYADIPQEGANVRSLVYCASAYLNKPEYAENEVLTDFVAKGFNKKAGLAETDSMDKLNEAVQGFEDSKTQENLLPDGKSEAWTTAAIQDMNLKVEYATTNAAYATIDQDGVITGVAGDGNAATTYGVTMKVLGKTYTKPVHVYEVAHAIENTEVAIYSAALMTQEETFSNKAELNVTAMVDNVNVDAADIKWETTDATVATVSGDVVTATLQSELFDGTKTANVSFSFEFKGKTFTSNECPVFVSFPVAYQNSPLAYGDLIQQVFNAENALEPTTEAINTTALGADFGNVKSFLSEDKGELLVDGKTDANKYGEQEAGEKNFIVVSEKGYAYKVKATVVNYAIGNDTAELDYFFNSYKEDTTQSADGSLYTTKGTYVILSADVEDYKGSPINTTSAWYAGTFDGRGHSIEQASSSTTAMKNGMFAKLTSTGVIKNTAFLGLMKTTAAGGGLAHTSYGVIDNCYVEIRMSITKAATANQGGVCWKNEGKITNTIVNVTETIQSTKERGTICYTNNDTIKNCFSIGCADIDSIIGSTSATEGDPLVMPQAGDDAATLLKGLIGSALPTSYNSAYWTYNAEAGTLFFGTAQVLIKVPEA